MIILCAADLHLQDGALWPDTYWGLRQLARYAEEEGVAAVLLGGDLLDRVRNRARPAAALIAFVAAMRALDVRVYYVRGNHDWDDPPWLTGTAAEHIDRTTVCLNGVRIGGLDHTGKETLAEALAAWNPGALDLLLCHQSWREWMPPIVECRNRLADVQGVDCLVSGDLHKCIVDERESYAGGPRIAASPGATCRHAIDEPDEHYVLAWEDGTFEKLPLRSRPHLRMAAATLEDLDRLLAELPERLRRAQDPELPPELRAPVVEIAYRADLPDVVNRVLAVGARHGGLIPYWRPKRAAGSVAAPSGRSADAVEVVTLAQALDLEIDVGERPAAHALAAALLAGGGAEAFDAWLEEQRR